MTEQARFTWPERLGMWRRRLKAWLQRFASEPTEAEALEDEAELLRVRLTAELSADWLCCGRISCVSNPWKSGTRQYVLWETSYHARLLQYEVADTAPSPLLQVGDAHWEPESSLTA